MTFQRGLLSLLLSVSLLAALLPTAVAASPDLAEPEVTAQQESPPLASGFSYRKYALPTCSNATFTTDVFSRDDCGFVRFSTRNTTAESVIKVEFLNPRNGTVFHTAEPANTGANGSYDVPIRPEEGWPAGEVDVRVLVDGAPAGQSQFRLNFLEAQVTPAAKADEAPYTPGEAIEVNGNIAQLDTGTLGSQTRTGVPATFTLRIDDAGGTQLGTVGPVTAADDGAFTASIPAAITSKVSAGLRTDFLTTIAVRAVDASFTDATSGAWGAIQAGSAGVEFYDAPDRLIIQNRFVSSTGWVKPGANFPYRVFVHNYTDRAASNVTVTIPTPASATFTSAQAKRGSAVAGRRLITWTIPTLAAAKDGVPTTAELIVRARAATLKADPEVVWKDLSSTATMREGGRTATSESHGPKVIPAPESFDTARYGDKPFPMVPVQYLDRSHEADHQGEDLDKVVNDPNFEGSTFNLYQEMSYGQLYPEGTVGSAGIAEATYSEYEPGFDFTTPEVGPNSDCRGFTAASVPGGVGSPAYDTRIVDGWYQLPGNTEYYGGDFPAFTLGLAGSIDSGCGQLGKVTYDAAAIADPEINYNDYDSDKDGVVDFFMTVFVGCGGNGASQVTPLCPYDDVPYDNVWPHSSDLQMQYRDAETGLRGYVSDDQLTDITGAPQCWTSEARTTSATCASAGGNGNNELPVYVRVGPYNVNPETSFDSASVISHEYGHHLGLPDFYSSDSLYADFNLMAADYSQHMTIFSKQELGWVVPEFLQPGQERQVRAWSEIKRDTGQIKWVRPDGKPYTLSAANDDQNIHNGKAFGVKLPQRILIDPKVVEEGASLSHIWHSGRGNDFGCPPDAGHNLDVFLPELQKVESGTPITVTFKSSWDIEWDWDYGFLMTSPDGVEFTSQPSENGYTTDNTYNPNSIQCMSQHDNGITGQSGAYEKGQAEVTKSRNPAANEYDDGAPFLEDSYDISELAGAKQPVLRFAYNTDGAFDRPGWFIDNVEVKAGDTVIYSSKFEKDEERDRLFPGGCRENIRVAEVCTVGWNRINAELPSSEDHAYYLELRDQSGFDFDGHNQSDRGDTSWDPGLLIEYTDETHGYGNNGVPLPPAQHYLDSQPTPGSDCGAETNGPCANAAFTDAAGDSRWSDFKTLAQPLGWIDNFEDDRNEEVCYADCDTSEPKTVHPWLFDYGCLQLNVQSMSGKGIGPEALPSDLTANVRLAAADGCRPFDYGGALNAAAVAANSACPSGMVPAPPFNDIGNSIHRANIACIAWYTITVGSGDGEAYSPAASVTRGQMASFIARLAVEAGVIDSLSTDSPNAFRDDNDNVHEAAINALAAKGLVKGTTARTFEPDARVTRAQMASFIANLHKAAVGNVTQPSKDFFTDDNRSVHEDNINLLASLGVVRGVGNNRYGPNRNVTREQMASFIAQDLHQLVEKGVAHTGGARVALDSVQTTPGGTLSGTLATNKRLESFTADGCGVDGKDVTVTDGKFEVTIGEGQEAGSKCSLELTAQTSRGTSGADRERQSATYSFIIVVRS